VSVEPSLTREKVEANVGTRGREKGNANHFPGRIDIAGRRKAPAPAWEKKECRFRFYQKGTRLQKSEFEKKSQKKTEGTKRNWVYQNALLFAGPLGGRKRAELGMGREKKKGEAYVTSLGSRRGEGVETGLRNLSVPKRNSYQLRGCEKERTVPPGVWGEKGGEATNRHPTAKKKWGTPIGSNFVVLPEWERKGGGEYEDKKEKKTPLPNEHPCI